MTIVGASGRIVCGPRVIARIGSWTLHRVDPSPRFEATLRVTVLDRFWWQQDGVEIVLEMGQRTWTWAVGTLPAYRSHVTVALDGPPVIA